MRANHLEERERGTIAWPIMLCLGVVIVFFATLTLEQDLSFTEKSLIGEASFVLRVINNASVDNNSLKVKIPNITESDIAARTAGIPTSQSDGLGDIVATMLHYSIQDRVSSKSAKPLGLLERMGIGEGDVPFNDQGRTAPIISNGVLDCCGFHGCTWSRLQEAMQRWVVGNLYEQIWSFKVTQRCFGDIGGPSCSISRLLSNIRALSHQLHLHLHQLSLLVNCNKLEDSRNEQPEGDSDEHYVRVEHLFMVALIRRGAIVIVWGWLSLYLLSWARERFGSWWAGWRGHCIEIVAYLSFALSLLLLFVTDFSWSWGWLL